jgi:hypothetical protein
LTYVPPVDPNWGQGKVWVVPKTPTLNGYLVWIRMVMGVPEAVLPNNSFYIPLTFEMAKETVHHWIDYVSPLMFTQAVYNCGGHYLVMTAQDNIYADPPLQPPNDTYWADLRNSLNLNGGGNFMPGVINEAQDESTSVAITTTDWLSGMTIADLQMMKTPWGRVYLSIAQCIGSMWGLTQ